MIHTEKFKDNYIYIYMEERWIATKQFILRKIGGGLLLARFNLLPDIR